MTVPDPGNLWEKLREADEWARKIAETPMPSAIFTDDRVPNIKRQWMSDGSLVLWVNSAVIDKLPRMAVREIPPDKPEMRWGIPIYDRREE